MEERRDWENRDSESPERCIFSPSHPRIRETSAQPRCLFISADIHTIRANSARVQWKRRPQRTTTGPSKPPAPLRKGKNALQMQYMYLPLTQANRRHSKAIRGHPSSAQDQARPGHTNEPSNVFHLGRGRPALHLEGM